MSKKIYLPCPTGNGTEAVKISRQWWTLSEWNGEEWGNCWKTEKNGKPKDNDTFTIRPIQEGVGTPDEDGYFEDYAIVNFEIWKN